MTKIVLDQDLVFEFVGLRFQLEMRQEVALKLLRQLDEQLHPWGWAGEVPAEDGEYYAFRDGEDRVRLACIETLDGIRMVHVEGLDECRPDDDDQVLEHQFRKRLTPTPPRERALETAWVVGRDDGE